MTKVIRECVKLRVSDLKREGKRQGEHFAVRRGILYIFTIPRSKMRKASELRWEGVSVEEVAKILELDVEALAKWYSE